MTKTYHIVNIGYLLYDNRMVGDKIKQILDIYETTVSSGTSACVCVHGVPGMGKTALLDKVKNAMLMSGANVYFAIGQENKLKQTVLRDDDSAFREILRQLARIYKDDADAGLMGFIENYTKYNPITTDIEKEALIKYIYQCVKTEPTVFIVDNLDKADFFTINLFFSLLKLKALAFLIISHTDKLENTDLTQQLYQNIERITYIELKDKAQNTNDADISSTSGGRLPLPDEAILVLSKPGMEQQLIRHYLKQAKQPAEQMAYGIAAQIFRDALEVCYKPGGNLTSIANPDIAALTFDVFYNLGSVQYPDMNIQAALESFRHAFELAGKFNFTDKRIKAAIMLIKCCKRLNLQDKAREYVMIAESFFYTQERRTQYYDMYKQHILEYLYLLADIDEKVIFREKIKQAYSVCKLDDDGFTCSLYCEEGVMLMENDEFDLAFGLLREAKDMAEHMGNNNLLDEAKCELAICAKEIGNTYDSLSLLDSVIKNSYNPEKTAQAKINAALILYDTDGDIKEAAGHIKAGIDLYMLLGLNHIVAQLKEKLDLTPLRKAFSGILIDNA